MTTPATQLKLIRETHAQATPDWKSSVGASDETIHVADDIDGEISDIATITANNPADAQLIRCAPDYIGFLLDLLYKSFAEVKRLKQFAPAPKPDKDYTTNCAIMCGEEPFIRFLQDRHNLQNTTKEAVAKKVRELCQISSRKQLNQSTVKAKNWRRLSREFEGWMQNAAS